MLAAARRAAGQRTRNAGQVVVDAACWTAGLLLAAWARYDFFLAGSRARPVFVVAAVAVALQTAIGHPLYLYRGRYAFGSFEEARAVSTAVSTTTIIVFALNMLLASRPLPASTPLTGGSLALLGMLAVRYVRRLQRDRARRPDSSSATRVLLFGAGDAGVRLVHTMLHDPAGDYLPVGLLDDDPGKRNLHVRGVPVLGGRRELPAAVARTGASMVVFAVPSSGSALVRKVRQLATEAGVGFKVLPALNELLDRSVAVSDIRDVDITDLLGRCQIETDLPAIAGYLTGRRVMVTGAGGSIGSELCRQIHRHAPAELIMLDRDESALHAVQLSIYGRAMLDDPGVLLADLRDTERVWEVFAERRPHVVFHAAALKHQPLLEQYPAEAVKSNVWGSLTVLEAASAHDVEVFVNVSTDKAADPCSVLGYSKRLAELLTAHVAMGATGRFLSVRFGNVLGSRGSVLTAFAAQLAAGEPLTVTDPEVTRYFMTVREAVQLVIQAGAIGRPGEALVLDMGQPVRIADVAKQMASLAGAEASIVYTGLRPGEKLHETLFGAGERGERRSHPLIFHVTVPPLDPSHAQLLDTTLGREKIIRELADLCGVGASGRVPELSGSAPFGR